MPRPGKTQKIWKVVDKDGNTKLEIPKVINTDIGFQLMFGPNDHEYENVRRINKYHDEYSMTVKVRTIEEIRFFK
tara:strand:- start:648 stop:872 length:225 start_codon:yes stop_codon:yes gene_type:complete